MPGLLVIDDDPSVVHFIRAACKDLGITIHAAEDAPDGLALDGRVAVGEFCAAATPFGKADVAASVFFAAFDDGGFAAFGADALGVAVAVFGLETVARAVAFGNEQVGTPKLAAIEVVEEGFAAVPFSGPILDGA